MAYSIGFQAYLKFLTRDLKILYEKNFKENIILIMENGMGEVVNNKTISKLVKIDNKFTEVRFPPDFTKTAMRLFAVFLNKVTEEEMSYQKIKWIKISEGVEISEISRESVRKVGRLGMTYDEIRERLGTDAHKMWNDLLTTELKKLALIITGVTVKKKLPDRTSFFPIILNVDVFDERPYVEFDIDERNKYLLEDLDDKGRSFLAFNREEFMELNTLDSQIMYFQIRGNRGIGRLSISIEQTRALLNIKDDVENPEVTRALNKACTRLVKYIPNLKWEPTKSGKNIRGYLITFDKNNTDDLKGIQYKVAQNKDKEKTETEKTKEKKKELQRGEERSYMELEVKAIERRKLGLITSDEQKVVEDYCQKIMKKQTVDDKLISEVCRIMNLKPGDLV